MSNEEFERKMAFIVEQQKEYESRDYDEFYLTGDNKSRLAFYHIARGVQPHMTNLCSTQSVRFLHLTILVILLLVSVASAQGPCKLKPVKVKGVLAGRVFLNRAGERQPLSGVAIDVLDRRDRRLVGSASSGEDGSYLVKGLDPGGYIIKTTHMIAADLEVELEIAKSEKEEPDRLVNIILGIDKEKDCGGGRVDTEKVK